MIETKKLTKEQRDAGFRISLQIHHGEIGFTEINDAEWERPITNGRLAAGGDLQATLAEAVDLLTRLVEASAFKPGEKVTWTGVRSGGPRYGTVHSVAPSEPNDFYGPMVTVRTDKGGYTTVSSTFLERV